MNGIFIPQEILKDERLNSNEKLVLSIYWYFTTNGDKHCCKLTNDEIQDELKMKRATLFNAKKQLKELGLIRCNGGIKVWYVGNTESKNETTESKIQTTESKIQTTESKIQTTESKIQTTESKIQTHNKEIKNKERIKENKEMQLSNFDELFNELPKEKRTDDYRKYILDNYEGWLNRLNGLSKKEFIEQKGVYLNSIKSIFSVIESKKAEEERNKYYEKMIEENKSQSGLFSFT